MKSSQRRWGARRWFQAGLAVLILLNTGIKASRYGNAACAIGSHAYLGALFAYGLRKLA